MIKIPADDSQIARLATKIGASLADELADKLDEEAKNSHAVAPIKKRYSNLAKEMPAVRAYFEYLAYKGSLEPLFHLRAGFYAGVVAAGESDAWAQAMDKPVAEFIQKHAVRGFLDRMRVRQERFLGSLS